MVLFENDGGGMAMEPDDDGEGTGRLLLPDGPGSGREDGDDEEETATVSWGDGWFPPLRCLVAAMVVWRVGEQVREEKGGAPGRRAALTHPRRSTSGHR